MTVLALLILLLFAVAVLPELAWPHPRREPDEHKQERAARATLYGRRRG